MAPLNKALDVLRICDELLGWSAGRRSYSRVSRKQYGLGFRWTRYCSALVLNSEFWSRYKAASNVLLAKYTFDEMVDSDKQAVLDEVAKIMAGAKYPIADPHAALAQAAPAERFGFYALAMSSLGMPPKIGHGWYDVRNPYTQIRGAHREFTTVRRQLRRKYGVDIELTSSETD